MSPSCSPCSPLPPLSPTLDVHSLQPFSEEKGTSLLPTSLAWHIRSHQDQAHPLPLRPDKAAQLGKGIQRQATESETAPAPVVRSPRRQLSCYTNVMLLSFLRKSVRSLPPVPIGSSHCSNSLNFKETHTRRPSAGQGPPHQPLLQFPRVVWIVAGNLGEGKQVVTLYQV